LVAVSVAGAIQQPQGLHINFMVRIDRDIEFAALVPPGEVCEHHCDVYPGSLHDLPKTARLRGMPITIAFRGNFERGF
jgi:hypothetical protein